MEEHEVLEMVESHSVDCPRAAGRRGLSRYRSMPVAGLSR